MIKLTIAKSVVAMVAGALVVGLPALFASVVPEARADTQVESSLHQPDAKSDRLPAAIVGAACSSQGWPYYAQSCEFDLRRPAHQARTVRILALR
jgi:hypothetical protein